MRFTLFHVFVAVTALCLMMGSGTKIPGPVAWAAALMVMWTGFWSAVSLGGEASTRWWRATLNTWLAILLATGIIFQRAAALMVVEVLWVTGLAALVIGTGATTGWRRKSAAPRRAYSVDTHSDVGAQAAFRQ